jgi:hypothetical protein
VDQALDADDPREVALGLGRIVTLRTSASYQIR